ncbi:hypothetical protein [Mesorhizobium sp. BH1-1-4]|uniref:hypothetical protein n=1 Tax=Mesorhizobium sp. BH1-1-4 TaxID=2876662 RepID=UPI001CD1310E|nr:hypothetical protein [Mesorhizobium sp. BH1-1-4]MBZ9995508.1 hypothetical protein [Mesorhizobium sp. BH1-1-4]
MAEWSTGRFIAAKLRVAIPAAAFPSMANWTILSYPWVLEVAPSALIADEVRGDLAQAIKAIGESTTTVSRSPETGQSFSQVGLFITNLDPSALARAAALWLFGVPIRTD